MAYWRLRCSFFVSFCIRRRAWSCRIRPVKNAVAGVFRRICRSAARRLFRPLELSRTTGGHPASDSSAAIMLPLSPFSEPLWGIGPKIPLFKYSCGSLLAFCPPPIDKPQQATFACWGHSFLVQRHISINLRIFVIIHRFHSSRILRREY